MGYHSNGAFRAKGKTDELFAVIAALRLTYPDQTALKEALIECTLTDGIFGFDVAEWKWYTDYPEIRALNDIMDGFREDEKRFSTAFIRIGEDDTDIETTYTGDEGYDLISLARTYNAVEFPPGTNLLSSTIDETRNDDDKELVT